MQALDCIIIWRMGIAWCEVDGRWHCLNFILMGFFFLIVTCILFFKNFIFTLFYFPMLYWFCQTLAWVCHGCTWVPNPEPPSHLPPHTISLDHPRAPAPSILYPVLNIDWRFISYMIVYMFQWRMVFFLFNFIVLRFPVSYSCFFKRESRSLDKDHICYYF